MWSMKLGLLYASLTMAATVGGASVALDAWVPTTSATVVVTNLRTLNTMTQSALAFDEGLTVEAALAQQAALLDLPIEVTGREARHEIAGECMVLTVHGFATGEDIRLCDEVAQ